MQESTGDFWICFWRWLGRAADIVGILGISALFLVYRDLAKKFFSRRILLSRILPIEPQFKGLTCLVSAPWPPSSDPSRSPDGISALVKAQADLTEPLLATPIGAVLKAIQHHLGHLKHCWLLASKDSQPYMSSLKEACQKYFPGLKLHDVIVVDVYCKIDDVYEAVHRIFDDCGQETAGEIRPGDIVTDLTGGNKIMSVGAAMACLDSDRAMQYLEQKERKTLYTIDITWEKIIRRPRGKQ